ncbi:MAG: MoxR family ATPase [Chloroflexi bacterium]|nr:MoxR family ATPase [Chloroflexota bacterium]
MPVQTLEVADLTDKIISEVEHAIIGKSEVLHMLMSVFLTSGGNALLEDYPGLAKTLIANCFATVLGLTFKRIQFTPDLLPGDITGGYIFDRNTAQFSLRKGPIFANIVLADEINRASPRTQSALLEAMQEHQVTLEGETMKLPEPFIVIATQNPIEYEGTFPLPEAQLDRFIMKLSVGYPSPEDEQEILHQRRERRQDAFDLKPIITVSDLLAMREAVEDVYVDPDIEAYIVNLVSATRKHRKVAVGASPRGTLALLKLARSWAVMNHRSYVLPDDVKRFAKPSLAHRLVLIPDLWTDRRAAGDIINDVLESIPVPVVK